MPEYSGTYIATVGSETEVFNTTAITVARNVFVRIFLTNLVSGDAITFYLYQRDNAGTYRLLDTITCTNEGYRKSGWFADNPSAVLALDGIYISDTLPLRVTGRQTAGTARSFPWKYADR